MYIYTINLKLNIMEVYEDVKNDQNNQIFDKTPLSLGSWVITVLLVAIPLINIIMLFVWAFGGNEDERKNFARASLIWMLIGFLITICFVGCVGCAAIAGLLESGSSII